MVCYGKGHKHRGRVYARTGNRARSRLVRDKQKNVRNMMKTLGVDYV